MKRLYLDDFTNFRQMLGEDKFEKLAKYPQENRPLDAYHGIKPVKSKEIKITPEGEKKTKRNIVTKVPHSKQRNLEVGIAQNRAEIKDVKKLKKFTDVRKRKDVRILVPIVDFHSEGHWVQMRKAKT